MEIFKQQLYWLYLQHKDFGTKTITNEKSNIKVKKERKEEFNIVIKEKISWLCAASTLLVW